MIILKGTSVFGGISFGQLQFIQEQKVIVKRTAVDDVEKEILRLQEALDTTVMQLQLLYDKALAEVGEANAMIFEIHQMMLADEDFTQSIQNIIRTQELNAEYAVATTADNFAGMFAAMEDEYMRERAVDVRDISERLISVLSGTSAAGIKSEEGIILAARDLTPSQTVQLEKDKIRAIVTQEGTVSSHTAILARTMNIPAIVAVGSQLSLEHDGKNVIVDGYAGTLYIEPDEQTISVMRQKYDEEQQKKIMLQTLKGLDNITKDGQSIDIYANIGGISDIAAVLQNDAGGVGLFRSEFLYLEAEDYPDETTQFKAYRMAAETLAGKRIIIRTLDIGADKQIDYFDLPKEENPAMGYRAIRICLDRPSLFKTQLRALLRASYYGKISIMFPMITSLNEVLEIKEILQSVKHMLDSDGIPYDKDIETGIMIETPAAAMISDILAKEVGFFSIGTNDLTQYTLALDRQNPMLERYYQPHHAGILRLIKMVADNAHKEGKWVGICGELAADINLTEFFLSVGIDELSVAPPFILPLRQKVRALDVSKNKDSIVKKHLSW